MAAYQVCPYQVDVHNDRNARPVALYRPRKKTRYSKGSEPGPMSRNFISSWRISLIQCAPNIPQLLYIWISVQRTFYYPPSLRQVHHRFVEETKTNRLVEVAIAKWQSQAVQAAAIFLSMRMVAIYLTCPCFPSLDRSAVARLAPLAMENLDFVASWGIRGPM